MLSLSDCKKSESEPVIRLSLNKERIVFDNSESDTPVRATLSIEADRRWSAVFTGDDCTLSASTGGAGISEITLETEASNPGRTLTTLGRLTFLLDDGSANQTIEVKQRPQINPQTLLMYFCGTDLYSYYRNNLADVAKALSKNILPLGRIVAFTQPTSGNGCIVEYRYDEETNACKRDTLVRYAPLPGQTTDPEIMSRILAEMAALAPAERYGLHLASHAKGWLPASIESSSWLRSARRSDDLWRKISGAPETRWFGYDRGRYMNVSELVAALDEVNVQFDYLLFDACFMSSVEALYDLRHSADYIIASPCEVMAYGFPYETVIPALFTDDGAQYDLVSACRNFYKHYNETASYNSGCVALTVCNELDALAASMREINAGTTKAVDPTTLQSYDGLKEHQFYDLEEYALQLTADDALGEAFKRQMERCFPLAGRFHTAQFFSVYNNRMNDIRYYSGVTTYAPATVYQDDWQQTAWYAETKK